MAFNAVLTILHQQCSYMQLIFIGHFPQAVAENSCRASCIKDDLQRFKESGAVQEQMPGRDERRRNSEDEQEQGRASQQVALPTSGGFIQGAPASSLELDLPLVRGAPGEGGSAGRSGTQGDRKRGPPDLQDGTPWIKEVMTIWVPQTKREKNSEGEDPRTFGRKQ